MAEANSFDKSVITYSEIALALANDYESVFVIDAEDDSYVEYIAEGDNKKLVIKLSGDNFYEDTIRNCHEMVYVEDQDLFLKYFKKSNIIDVLTSGESFILNYRLMVDGKPLHYFLKTIKGNDQSVIIGVQNVDEQVRKQQTLDLERITYRRIAGALASRYEAIYYINIKDDSYVMYSSSNEHDKLGLTKQGTDFFKFVLDAASKTIEKQDFKYIKTILNKSYILKRLSNETSASIVYRQLYENEMVFITSIVVRPKNDPDHIVMGIMNIDAQMKYEQHIVEESNKFNEVAMALASRYEVIYRVNVITNEYSEFSSSSKYSKLDVGSIGNDFFADTQRNMKSDIYEDDYPMMAREMDKDHLLSKLDKVDKVVLDYRLMLDGRPQYMSLVIVRPKEESDYIIAALENIDDAKRREIGYEAAIGTAIDLANRDSLTGVKNKHAYVNAEVQLDSAIANRGAGEFAIVVCDINGLKQVNDNQGHTSGDKFITDACSIICNIFNHSPVYRIGGDEFVVILKGSDYANRYELVRQFTQKQFENKKNGLVTMAFGLSEYNPDRDNRTQDVFERADNLMYENKTMFKNLPDQLDDSPQIESYSFVRFYELYEQLLTQMVTFKDPDNKAIEDLLIKICNMFRLSKAVTRVYRNPREEIEGGGETLCCFDLKEECNEILRLRVETSVMTSATLTVYQSPSKKPLTREEYQKVELVTRTILSFVSRNRLKDVVYELAFYDESGYPNLRSWNKMLVDSMRIPDFANKVFFRYNLRHFTLVNEEFGKDAGDVVMKTHFEMLKEIVGESGFLARLGGDNFIGICTKDKLREVSSFLTEVSIRVDEENSVMIGTSAGFLVIPEGFRPRDPGELMSRITIAITAAQSGVMDRIVFFSDELLKGRDKRIRVQQVFPEAMERGEFVPFYQPKVNIVTGKLYGAEALCRWFHEGNIVSPADFIPALEETKDICKLDLYMLERVCKDLRRWIDEGKDVVCVSVNFSRKNMLNLDVPGKICAVIDRYNVPHELIEIELTETTTDVKFSDLKRIANALHSKGIRTSVDDFGMGYSSLNLLKEVSWNTLKIDRTFVPESDDDENRSSVIMFRSVATLAGSLGLECIAEGIETREQIEVMRKNGCEIAQGFFFDKPLPVDEFERRLINPYYGS